MNNKIALLPHLYKIKVLSLRKLKEIVVNQK